MRRINVLMMILAVINVASLVEGAPVTLPFADSFDVSIDGDWVGEGNVRTNVPARAETGTHSMYVETSATLPVEAGNPNVWFSFYSQMVALPSDEANPGISTNAAAFFMKVDGATGDLLAYDGSNYTEVATGLATNGWHGFAVHLDFTNKTWNLYHKNPDQGHDAPFSLLNIAEPMGMYTGFTASAISAFEVSGGDTLIDHVSIMKSVQPAMPSVAPPTNAASAELILEGAASGILFTYIGTNGALDGALGEMLEDLFSEGDKLYFWNGTALIPSTLQALGWSTNVTITPTTGFFFERASGVTNERTVAVFYSEPYSHVGLDATPVAEGWNLFAVPYTAGSRALGTLGLPENQYDQIFLWTDEGWVILMYRGTSWFRGGANYNGEMIPAGRSFWYNNRGAADDWPALN